MGVGRGSGCGRDDVTELDPGFSSAIASHVPCEGDPDGERVANVDGLHAAGDWVAAEGSGVRSTSTAAAGFGGCD